MITTFIIVATLLLIIVAFVTIDNDLRILKEKDYHGAIQHSAFMRLMDKIFNDFFEWNRWKKILAVSFIVLVALVLTGLLVVRFAFPRVPALPAISINHGDSALLKRGAYLVESVAICTDCHSPRDVNVFSWPVIEEKKGAGAAFLSRKAGFPIFPGESFTPNITPAHLGNWTDAELYRLLTTGIRKDGTTVNHAMPFESFSQADPDDLKAIIAYIRTLQPVNAEPAGTTETMLLHSLYNRIISRKVRPVYLRDLKTAVDSGRYLVNLASCNDCHTPKKWIEINDESRKLSGGIEFPMPTGGFVHSANLTPDESGLGNWTAETFVNRFKSYTDSAALFTVEPGKLNSLMPWGVYRHMTEQDLRNIFAYLQSLKPVYNPVTKFTAEKIEKKKSEQ